MTNTVITTAKQWADALDSELTSKYGGCVSDQISYAYADNNAAGVNLSYDDPEIDDERGALVSADSAWIVRYDVRNAWWVAD
jgi:hypothetical protein